jgi:hypothetical protein
VLVLDMIEILPPWENINMIPGEYSGKSATMTIPCACGAAYETSTISMPQFNPSHLLQNERRRAL